MLISIKKVLYHNMSAIMPIALLTLPVACNIATHSVGSYSVSNVESPYYFQLMLAPFAKMSRGAGPGGQPDRFTAECSGDLLTTEYVTGYGEVKEVTILNLTSGEISSFGRQLLPPDKGGDSASYLAALGKMQSILELVAADKAVEFIKSAIAQVNLAPSAMQSDSTDHHIAIEGDEATQLIDALFKSGARDPSRRLGAVHLMVEGVQCSAPVVADAVPSCTLTMGDEELKAPQEAADAIFRILKAHGAIIPRDLLGIDIVGAANVDCQRVTVRGGVNKCSFNSPSGQ